MTTCLAIRLLSADGYRRRTFSAAYDGALEHRATAEPWFAECGKTQTSTPRPPALLRWTRWERGFRRWLSDRLAAASITPSRWRGVRLPSVYADAWHFAGEPVLITLPQHYLPCPMHLLRRTVSTCQNSTGPSVGIGDSARTEKYIFQNEIFERKYLENTFSYVSSTISWLRMSDYLITTITLQRLKHTKAFITNMKVILITKYKKFNCEIFLKT
jgi:hypothetical protein